MATKAVTKPAEPQVPELRRPPLEIDSQDVALPKLKLGQYTSEAVKDQLVKPGSIYTTTGGDDPDPVVLWQPGEEGGVVFYVIGMRKGKSYSAPGQDLETYAFNDPDAPAGAWVTYTYTIAIPSEDEQVPYTVLLSKSAKPAAKQVNTALVKSDKVPWATAFSMTTKHRENAKGEWFVPIISIVETNDAHVALAGEMAVMVAGQTAEFQSTGEVPAI